MTADSDTHTADLDAIVDRHGRNPHALLQILLDAQERYGYISPAAITSLGIKLNIPRVQIEGVAGFYSFLNLHPNGEYRVLFSDNITDRMLGSQALMEQMCQQLWLQPGKASEDGLVSISTTSCTGMCDQGPAMLVNNRAITRLTNARIASICCDTTIAPNSAEIADPMRPETIRADKTGPSSRIIEVATDFPT